MFHRVAIIGLGLIGSSIGLALRTSKAAQRVVGYDANKHQAHQAHKSGAIDQSYPSLADAIRGSEFIVLATPINAFRSSFQDIAAIASPGTVVTDVASTKAQVISWAEEYLPSSVFFVGGHPIISKEYYQEGLTSAVLFKNCVYCLTPTKRTSSTAIDKVIQLIELLGARVRFLEPLEHDGLVAGVNHVPFILSAVLMKTIAESPSWADAAIVADDSMYNMTRLTVKDPEVYRDICLANSEALSRWLGEYIQELLVFRDQLDLHDSNLIQTFARSQKLREQWQAMQNATNKPE
ncbi:MAG TPA: prephenate dehydrogenase [Ktedonobacteraceae bacterium]|nr:prephenate dehydrogenase [Ktedonobacteraceae bacterium]